MAEKGFEDKRSLWSLSPAHLSPGPRSLWFSSHHSSPPSITVPQRSVLGVLALCLTPRRPYHMPWLSISPLHWWYPTPSSTWELSSTIRSIWMAHHCVTFNTAKAKLLVFSSKLAWLCMLSISVEISFCFPEEAGGQRPSFPVSSLSCCFFLHTIAKVCSSLSASLAQSPVHTRGIFHVNYCNFLVFGTPLSHLGSIISFQNSVAKIT